MRIKICGITRPEDAIAAANAGADAIGLVFAESPRQISLARAREIVAALPPYVSAVGLFVNEQAEKLRETVAAVGLGEVQLHGDEPPDFIARLAGLRVVKAVRVRDQSFLDQVRRFRQAGVGGILLEAFSTEARGGSGKRFDWDLVTGARNAGALEDTPPLIIAGGLTPRNVAAAVRRLRPWGVDVSTGVEESPGIKDPEKMAEFVAAAHAAAKRPPRKKPV